MVIEITEEVANALSKDKTVAEVLCDLAYASRKGMHYVVASRNVYQIIGMSTSLDKTAKGIYKELSKEKFAESVIAVRICFKVMLSITEETHREEDRIVMNVNDCLGFNFCDETRLLCENLMDCKFYGHVLEFYKVKNRLSKIHNEYEPMLGGGGDNCGRL